MAAQVIAPKKNSNGAKVATALGAVVGGYMGGPQGAISGAQTGNSLGTALAGNTNQQVPSSAVERRMQGGGSDLNLMQPPPQQGVEDPQRALEDARLALQSQSPEVRQQYEPAIQAAMLKARRGMA